MLPVLNMWCSGSRSKDDIIENQREEIAQLKHQNARTIKGLREREQHIASCERRLSGFERLECFSEE